MLATRIIPTLLARGRELVKGERFNSHRRVGNALSAARVHNMREVDELCVLNVSGQPWDLDDVHTLCFDCFMPVTVGGGVSTIEEFRQLIACGADKVCIKRESLIAPAAEKFGSQSVVFCINANFEGDGEYMARAAWTAARAAKLGAGEILLQSVERDGTMAGYDTLLTRYVAKAVDIPVVTSGGCSGYADMVNALNAGAHAVAAGALFQFTDCTPQGAAKYLKAAGFHTRVAA